MVEIPVPARHKNVFEIQAGACRARWDAESLLFAECCAPYSKGRNPDVTLNYYLHDGLFNSAVGTNVLYLLGCPEDSHISRAASLRFYDAVISISRHVERWWQRDIADTQAKYVLWSGTDCPEDRSIAPKPAALNLVFAGRLIERKGVDTLLQSLPAVLRQHPDLCLSILGDGPERHRLEALSVELGIAEKVRFCGLLDDVRAHFRMADICVFPSKEREGLLGVVVEAMSEGCAIVTTSGNGSEEVLVSGESGILLEPRNPGLLAEAITELLNNPSKRTLLGQGAKSFAKERLTWKASVQGLSDILSNVKSGAVNGLQQGISPKESRDAR
jgi:glycosyltransferase involved in cell wall biosynthesis